MSLLASLVAVWIAAAQQPPGPGTGKPAEKCSLSGRVLSAVSGQPLAKARVQLQNVGARMGPQSAEVDAMGRFRFINLASGQYRLSAVRRGYARQEYGAKRAGGDGAVVSVKAGEHLDDLQIRLFPHAVVSGRVLDEDGEPVAYAQIVAMKPTWDASAKKRLLVEVNRDLSNDLGEYRLWGFAPGRYYLKVSKGQRRYRTGLSPGWSSEPEMGYAPVYYPGETEASKAAALELAAGASLRGIDLRLVRTPVYRVRGKLLDGSGKPETRASVWLSPQGRGDQAWDEGQDTGPDEQGNFEFRDVAPGSYSLGASAGGDSSDNWHAVASVEVAGQNVSGLVLTMKPGFELTGTARMEGNEKPDWPDAYILLQPEQEIRLGVVGSGAIKADGSFRLRNIAQVRYRLVAACGEGCYLKSASLGKQNAADTVLDFTQGPPTVTLQVIFSCRTAEISGLVEDANGKPVAGATVALLPPARLRDQPDKYRQVTTDQYGQYRMRDVPPDDYNIIAFDEVDPGDIYDPDFLRAFEGSAKLVSTKEAGRESVDLTVVVADPERRKQSQER